MVCWHSLESATKTRMSLLDTSASVLLPRTLYFDSEMCKSLFLIGTFSQRKNHLSWLVILFLCLSTSNSYCCDQDNTFQSSQLLPGIPLLTCEQASSRWTELNSEYVVSSSEQVKTHVSVKKDDLNKSLSVAYEGLRMPVWCQNSSDAKRLDY